MVNLIKILPLILTLTMACNSMETIPQREKAETEKLNPKNNDVNSNGNLLSSSSKFGFTATSQKVTGRDGEYVVSLSKSPNNPLNSMNYMPVITPMSWTTPVFTGSQVPSKTSFSVYVRSRDGGQDMQFRFALIAMQDLDLRDQFGL